MAVMKAETSIIVPVYNEEENILECYKAIKNMTYDKYEVILIDDGSTDKTPAICDQLSLADERIIVLHQDNQGQSAARNLGLSVASGEYIFFLDADDIVSVDAIQMMMTALKQYQTDFVMADAKRVDMNGNIKEKLWRNEEQYYDSDKLLGVFEDYMENERANRLLCSVWGKLYKKSIIDDNNIRFDNGLRLHEDELFVIQYMTHIKSMYYIPRFIYTYYRNKNNVGSSFAPDNLNGVKKLTLALSNGLGEKIKSNFIGNFYCDYVISSCYHVVRNMNVSSVHDFLEIRKRVDAFITDTQFRENMKYYLHNNPDNFSCIWFFARLRATLLLIIAFKVQIFCQRHELR